MSDIITSDRNEMAIPLPSPKTAIEVRQAELKDLSFVDGLQRIHTKAVGWMPTAQLEGIIKQGKVLIAEEKASEDRGSRMEDGKSDSSPSSILYPPSSSASPVGYCIGQDRYFKHDDVGIIYQMNVVPGKQRGLIGANLLKAQFERSAYGCKLYCCWCAQDLPANKFWEAMGFVPLAFRTGGTGSAGKGKVRMHIFWQKRIRKNDDSTPWWFPSETASGAIRANRIVLPIPPGTHWSDAKPIVLPGMEVGASANALPGPKAPRVKKPKVPELPKNAPFGLRFGPIAPAPGQKPAKAEKKEQVKNDPRLVEAARELKDRWLEQVNSGQMALPCGKYEVSRQVDGPGAVQVPLQIEQMPMAA